MNAAQSNGTGLGNDGTLAALVQVLDASAQRLVDQVEQLTPAQLRQQAYPSEWTVADVLSHLGSGATIMRLRLDGDVDAAGGLGRMERQGPRRPGSGLAVGGRPACKTG